MINQDSGITIKWCISDVQAIAPHLTNEQAMDVLQCVKRNHDAIVGINWDVIEEQIIFSYGFED